MEKPFDQSQVDAITSKFDQNIALNHQDIIENIVNKFDSNKEFENIENIDQVLKEERVQKLIENGVLCDLEGYEWGCLGGDRFYVFANINGVPVPMYKTSARTGGKRSDVDFFPFFGTQANNQDWLIKGDTDDDTNNFYGVKDLENTSKVLTEAFNFNTDRLKKEENTNFRQGVDSPWDKVVDVDNFVPKGEEIKSSSQLNSLIGKRFGIDFDVVNHMPPYSMSAVKYISEKIFQQTKE